ncbi:MAG: hypothetical protein WA634_13745 [Silvibacterium sp.]
MATLTITGSNNNYSVSPDPCNVPVGESLTVDVPSGGCLICLDKVLGDTKSHKLSQDKTIDMSNYPNADEWTYSVYDYNASCPSGGIADNPSHTIQVGSGM